MINGWSPTRVVQMVLIGYISRSWGQKYVFKMQFSKIFLSETTRPRALIFSLELLMGILPNTTGMVTGVRVHTVFSFFVLHSIKRKTEIKLLYTVFRFSYYLIKKRKTISHTVFCFSYNQTKHEIRNSVL